MTKKEALQQMRAGQKVTHRYFSDGEWMTLRHNKLLFEDGIVFDQEPFWADRQGEQWEDGYSLFEPSNQPTEQGSLEAPTALNELINDYRARAKRLRNYDNLVSQSTADVYDCVADDIDKNISDIHWQQSQQSGYSEAQVLPIFRWLLGYEDFTERPEGKGAYWWRSELFEKLKAIGITPEIMSKNNP